MDLYSNQNNALNCAIKNNFKSGVYFHATGTGKSLIALNILLEYNKINKSNNILWLCEQKSILNEQFNEDTLKKKGFNNIDNLFKIFNYVTDKKKNWYDEINKYDEKNPILLIINRSFLVSKNNYEKINKLFNLIIHDECHSIKNKTTKIFYDYILNKNKNLSCLGFSATPFLEYEPYKNIISEYTIHDAFIDNVILPPKIVWFKSEKILDEYDIVHLCKKQIQKLYYKKIIVWCGIIEQCIYLSEIWKIYFPNYLVCIDTSKTNDNLYDEFCRKENSAILFCASKHREGSDIKNLDCCIFLDGVENRNSKTFVQCVGRVLRKDYLNKKEYGLVLDLKANSCIKICDRMNEYLSCNEYFPWDYKYTNTFDNSIIINELILTNKSNNTINLKQYNNHISEYFVRKYPFTDKYINRLNLEFKMISEKKLENYLLRAVEILKITNNIPHVTRGSCGSSLICYLLGISNVDPVENNISFARFLNEYRDTLPDIDYDFPHYMRDEVFLKLELNYPNKVARISNHVYWHEKSALREAIRRIGIKKLIPKENINSFVNSLPKEKKQKVTKIKKELENTFRNYSLHCGGIIFFDDGVPNELKLNKKTITQIVYDKNDVSKTKQFKIDILSSRGISQLMNITNNIDFSEFIYDKKTFDLLKNGDNIGITLAESPLIRKAFLKIKPNSIHDIAICLAIIRPAAENDCLKDQNIDYNNELIFDDDAIKILSNTLNIDEGLADKFRRYISKDKWNKDDKILFDNLLEKINPNEKIKLLKRLNNLRKYSFCKSHSYSYAQLVYKLAYQKAHNPKLFWKSTLKHVNSSYRKWVHLYEAHKHGIYKVNDDKSLYAQNRNKSFENLPFNEQLSRYGYWNMKTTNFYKNAYFYKKNDTYFFCGLIASLRILDYEKKVIVCLINTGNKYIEILTTGSYNKPNSIGLKGRAFLVCDETKTYKAFISYYF